MSREPLSRAQLAAGGTGLVIGLCAGYSVAAASQYELATPIVALYLVLFYGLGIAILLVGYVLRRGLSPNKKPYPLPMSIGFACAYYAGCALFFIPYLFAAEDVGRELISSMLASSAPAAV